MGTVKQNENGGWVGVTSWGYGEDTAWATEEMARAVAEMPEPAPEVWVREAQYWKDKYNGLVKDLDKEPGYRESLRGLLYLRATSFPSSPLEMQATRVALNAKKRYSEPHDTE